MEIHVVQSGESIYSIANQYGISREQLIRDNGLGNPPSLAVGQALVIQYPAQVHQVVAGETLLSISENAGLSLREIYRNNPQLNALPTIFPGQELVLSYQQQRIGSISVSGYAYPYIDMALLRRTMPFLTYIIPFTYGIQTTGELVYLADEPMLNLAQEYAVAPLMSLSSMTEAGNFDSALVSRVLNEPVLQQTLLNAVERNIQQKGYRGLDVDFEFISAEDRDLFTAFLRRSAEQLNPLGYILSVALAPKTSSEQEGLLYEGHDYAGIGQVVNFVFLMTYEWGYTYGPPMAVAPINQVRAVLDYAVTQISTDKIWMGIPNYGYDWTLPFVQGQSRAQSISNEEAVALAIRYHVPIQYDETAQSPYFHYTDEQGRAHEVWFEDARSIRQKLLLVSEYRLNGVGYWNLMRPFAQNWAVLNALYDIKENG